MALTSTFYDGVVTETDRAKGRGGAPDYGVYGVGDFAVTAHPTIPYNVLVKAGRAHGHGITDTATIDQVVPCNSLASGTRWDLIVVRRNWQPTLGGPSTLVAIPGGTTAAIPAARKVGPGIEDDQPIALVKWQGGLSAPAQIIDLRVWAANGGLYAKDDLVRSYLTKVGTRLCIGGTDWIRRLGANDTEEWVASEFKPTDSGWLVPTVFGNGFTPYNASGYDGVKYRLLNGYVHVSGAAINSGGWASGKAICALPAGYSPTRKIVGTNCVVDPSGNVLTTLDAPGSATATFAATYPLG